MAQEAVKKLQDEQKHFTQRRKVAEDAKKTRKLLFASLCALASLREIVCFFTPSQAVGKSPPHPARAPQGAKEITAKGTGAIASFLGGQEPET